MVKFAEAEKRGRGGESNSSSGGSVGGGGGGGSSNNSSSTNRPFMMMDRQKINRAMWEGLKQHIMQERRRKQEGMLFVYLLQIWI